jgi:hypothetical protein
MTKRSVPGPRTGTQTEKEEDPGKRGFKGRERKHAGSFLSGNPSVAV